MDGRGLLSFLESIRHEIPGAFQGDFEDLIQLVRNIVDAVEQIVAPPEVIQGGKQQLLTHHTTLVEHATTLQTNLTSFQTVYAGHDSDAYFLAANHSLQQLQLLNDHLSFATSTHDTIANNLGDAQVAQDVLFGIIAAFVVTLFLLPEGVPAFAAEGVGGGFSVAALWSALGSVGTALTGLAAAALPYIAVGAIALVTVTAVSSDTTTSNIVFSITKETPDGRRIRVRKLSNREVSKLKTEFGIRFEREKAKGGGKSTDDIYVDQNGDYWLGRPGTDTVEPFP